MTDYKDDSIWLMKGDCLERMKEIESGSVEMILTDPPYGMGFQSNWSKTGPRHKKIIGDEKVNGDFLSECYRVAGESAVLYLFSDWKNSHEWMLEIERHGFKIRSQVIWDRLHHGMGDLKGAHSPRHDVIWMATKGRPTFTGKRPCSVIQSKRPSPSEDFGHPTCKPVDLMEQLISPWPSKSILDPFIGSGSTGVAARNLGCKFIGIEMDDHYFDVAKGRILGERNG